MPKCVDRSARALSDQGYNLVKFPRATISPLDVLGRANDRFEWLGPIGEIWTTDTAAPVAQSSGVPQFSYQSSSQYNGAFGLNVLDGLIKNFGGSGKATLDRRTKLTFSFKNPQCDAIAPVAVGSFLKDGDLDFSNPFLSAFMKQGKVESDFYVVTEVLRSKELSVTVENSSTAVLEADVSALQNLAKGNVSVNAVGASTKEILYVGADLLTFAFKAFEIAHDDGAWRVLGVPSAQGYLSSSVSSKGVILDDSAPIDVVQAT